jgi:hypothetical protein
MIDLGDVIEKIFVKKNSGHESIPSRRFGAGLVPCCINYT